MSIEEINDMDFAECINASYGGFTGAEDQHLFMSDFMIPTMVQILNEIKSILFTSEQLTSVLYPTNGSLMMYEPMQNANGTYSISDIPVPWDWNAFFTNISYTGLHNCAAFPILFPPDSIPRYWWTQYNGAATVFNP
jgi:hypothetical protein